MRTSFVLSLQFFLVSAALSAGSLEFDLKRNVGSAKTIVIGQVDRIASYYSADGEIQTDVTLRIESALKKFEGALANSMTFTVPGGEVGDFGVLYTSAPRFFEGEAVIVFFEDSGDGVLNASAKFDLGSSVIPEAGMSPLELLARVSQELSDSGVPVPEKDWSRAANFLTKTFGPSFKEPLAAAAICYKPLGPKWPSKAASYRFDPTLPANFQAPITEGAAAWNNGGTPFRFSLQSASGNLINYAAIATSGVLASTRVGYQPSTNAIVSFTMTFNTNYPWSSTGEPGKYDVQNVGTHELGHALGLDHPSDASCGEQTMWASAGAGETKKRSVEQGDIDGETSLYGGGGTVPAPTPALLTPVFTAVYFYPQATLNRPFYIIATGRDFDAAVLQYVLQGPGCPAGCIIERTALQQVTATQAMGVFTAAKAGTYRLNLRNGATGAISLGTAQFIVR